MKNKRYTAKITLLFIHRVIHVESTGWLGITELCIFRLWKSRFARMHGKDQPSPRISGKEYSSSCRIMYIAICRG